MTFAEVLLGLRQLRAQGSADPRALALLVREIERLNARISRLVGLPHQFVSVAPLQKSLSVLVRVLRGGGKATPGELQAAEAPLDALWQSLASLEGSIQIQAPVRAPRRKTPETLERASRTEEQRIREWVADALTKSHGDVAEAAKLLKTQPSTLLAWMKALRIPLAQPRARVNRQRSRS